MFKPKNLKGFTLIEILIATSILVMVGVAAIGIERNFMGSGSYTKHKLQATGLAQEGISAVKAKYNANLLDDKSSQDLMKIVGGNAIPESGQTYVLGDDGMLRKYNENSPEANKNGKVELNEVIFTRTITFPSQQ